MVQDQIIVPMPEVEENPYCANITNITPSDKMLTLFIPIESYSNVPQISSVAITTEFIKAHLQLRR